jgi:predicted outer membrane repeat protein
VNNTGLKLQQSVAFISLSGVASTVISGGGNTIFNINAPKIAFEGITFTAGSALSINGITNFQTSLSGCVLTGSSGYSIYLGNAQGSLIINNTRIYKNNQAILCEYSSQAIILNSSIDSNTNSYTNYGGGIEATGCSFIIQHTNISNNSAITSGGGIYSTSSSSFLISSSFISGNSATTDGGGFYCDQFSSANILDSFILNNEANIAGAGDCGSSCTLVLQNTVVLNNESASGNNGTCNWNQN